MNHRPELNRSIEGPAELYLAERPENDIFDGRGMPGGSVANKLTREYGPEGTGWGVETEQFAIENQEKDDDHAPEFKLAQEALHNWLWKGRYELVDGTDVNGRVQAYVRDPDLVNVVIYPDGKQHSAEREHRQEASDLLTSLGIAGEKQSDESIRCGIDNAEWLVVTGEAVETLRLRRFTSVDNLGKFLAQDWPTKTMDFSPDNPITVRWDRIDGASSFDSWLGRVNEGEGGVDGYASSKDKIFDFATRKSALPSIELTVILTPEGPINLATNDHRAAAAILRNENIGCHYLRLIDAREA